ncbi:S41 family peptidase [Sinomicrobium weinanense]|uniref:Tricorn protease homolog n=1 Tax=Sinomicrobium weinanense TaxID=2842200 RepID=A0A926JQ94_9FLAO|nr:S41 family peptidase [Sinomicrobium weinanense]MBC9795312.1 PDZ domain-containing protein [Sinomicrobium weinanense]MBU3122973.1 PDZ domain-containing protein [Sinomicrobium weinanense]
MKNQTRTFLAFILILFNLALLKSAPDPENTRLLSQPALSDTHIAFIYAEDLWVANKDGSNPRRLTIDEGIESNPVFSPDGSLVAFNAEYDGSTDVYIVPVTGGVPRRLTWHPYDDTVRGFSPDGKRVLFASQRSTFTNRFDQLFTMSVEGGKVTQLDIPNAFWASYAPDGKHIAYTPLFDAFKQWKHYRGGTISRIWLYNTEDHSVVEIPKPAGGCNDSNPEWMDSRIYFRSDRNGEFNLFSYDTETKEIVQLTHYEDFPVMDLAVHNGQVVFEQAGYLHIYETASGNIDHIEVGIATDLLELRPRFVSGSNYVRSISISPSGARVVVDFRGEIVTAPAEKGNPVNLTNTPGVHENMPEWSPDGKSIAYFSDAGGEYALHIKDKDGEGKEKVISPGGTGFYAYVRWSPDSKKVSFVDNGRNFYVVNIVTGKIKKIASDKQYVPGAFRNLFGDWSPDSNWIAYTVITETHFERAYLYSVKEDKSYPLSDGLSNVSSPVFDPSGKYLYMLASTDAGPVVNWFDQSTLDMEMSSSIYLVTLQKKTRSPFAKENDEEKAVAEEEEENEDTEKGKDKNKKEEPPLIIDWDNIEHRIVDIPIPAGMYSDLGIAKEGELFYLAAAPHNGSPAMLHKYDLNERKDEEIMAADAYVIAARGEKMLYRNEGKWGITDTGKKPDNGMLGLGTIQVKIDPVAEWNNIFEEAWRVNRDYFYDPGMHGADWKAMKEKYGAFLPDLSCRSDLYRVMEWMFSELAVGHHRFGSRGDRMHNPGKIKGGLLGADYEVAGNRYRFKKIYGGLNWNPELRSPLTEPGVNVNAGDYLLAVNGNEVMAEDNLYSFFENTADRIVTLTVSTTNSTSDARKVKVTPVASEWALRNRDWVEGNMKKVHEATDGQVAYVYVPNTSVAGHKYFKRYFFPQANKKAIIIDERFNGGGSLADYYIDILKRPEQAYWNFRYGNDLKSPSASIQGPKVMLIDETAGSGGDFLPWMFRKFKLGKLIGKRTWGGLVGILGFPQFIDGGSVMAPNVAFYNEEGFRIENEGIAPDIKVEQWPEQVIQGKDPQLERAIEEVMKELKANPPRKMESPPYPVRVRK